MNDNATAEGGHIKITVNEDLEPGEVSLTFHHEGVTVAHNITSLRETGELGAPDCGLMMMAMSLLEIIESDGDALRAAMTRVATRAKGPGLGLVN